MGLTPTRVLVKGGMMYPVIGKSAANFGISSRAVADNLYKCPVVVPILIFEAFVLGGPWGADGAM